MCVSEKIKMGLIRCYYILIFIIYKGQLSECTNQTDTAEYRLYNDIFKDYNPLLRPRFNSAEPVVVELEFELNYIAGLDDVNEIMNSVGFIVAIWYDEFLVWDEALYENMNHLVMNANKIWLPDLGIKNSATKFTDKSYRDDFRVDIMNNGRIVWKFGGKFSTFCTLDMTYYPFDLQTCNVDIENWLYTSDTVDLKNISHEIHLQEFSPNGEWNLDHTTCILQTYTEDTHPGKLYPRVRFSVYIARKFQYYIINIILPALFVISISIMVFWLPPDSGEKVSLSVTVLLAFSVFQLVIMEHTPRTSDYTPVMTVLFNIIMGEATFSVFTSILVLYYHHHGPESRPPKVIRFIGFKVLAKILFMKNQMPSNLKRIEKLNENTDKLTKRQYTADDVMVNGSDTKLSSKTTKQFHNQDETNMNNSIFDKSIVNSVCSEKYLNDISTCIMNYSNELDQKKKDEVIKTEWKCIARIIDRTFFWLSFIATLIIIPVLLFSRASPHNISN